MERTGSTTLLSNSASNASRTPSYGTTTTRGIGTGTTPASVISTDSSVTGPASPVASCGSSTNRTRERSRPYTRKKRSFWNAQDSKLRSWWTTSTTRCAGVRSSASRSEDATAMSCMKNTVVANCR